MDGKWRRKTNDALQRNKTGPTTNEFDLPFYHSGKGSKSRREFTNLPKNFFHFPLCSFWIMLGTVLLMLESGRRRYMTGTEISWCCQSGSLSPQQKWHYTISSLYTGKGHFCISLNFWPFAEFVCSWLHSVHDCNILQPPSLNASLYGLCFTNLLKVQSESDKDVEPKIE